MQTVPCWRVGLVTSGMGGEGGGRRPGAEQVGMQLLPAGYIDEWVGGGGAGQSCATLLHLERWSQKWQRDVTAVITHKQGVFLIFSTSIRTQGGEREVMQTSKKKRAKLNFILKTH